MWQCPFPYEISPWLLFFFAVLLPPAVGKAPLRQSSSRRPARTDDAPALPCAPPLWKIDPPRPACRKILPVKQTEERQFGRGGEDTPAGSELVGQGEPFGRVGMLSHLEQMGGLLRPEERRFSRGGGDTPAGGKAARPDLSPLCHGKSRKKPPVEGHSPPGGFAVFYKNFYRNFGNQKNRLSSPAKPQPWRASSLHISCTVSWIAS